jgi:hypothetical protein
VSSSSDEVESHPLLEVVLLEMRGVEISRFPRLVGETGDAASAWPDFTAPTGGIKQPAISGGVTDAGVIVATLVNL